LVDLLYGWEFVGLNCVGLKLFREVLDIWNKNLKSDIYMVLLNMLEFQRWKLNEEYRKSFN
jgi:hypothetical protein